MKQIFDAIVIGGGLAGLTAATFLARAGKSVILFEKSSRPGGRAITESENGFHMNLGPHALYRSGEGFKILQELGISFSGKSPSGKKSHVLYKNQLSKLPYEPISLMKSAIFKSWRSKLELILFLKNLPKIQTEALQSQNLRDWLGYTFHHHEVRDFITMLVRVATYTNDAENLSAGAALAQLQMVIAKSVLYLDHGWQVLVDGLRNAAEKAGAQVMPGSPVDAIDFGKLTHSIQLAKGESFTARNIVIAVGPLEAAKLMGTQQKQNLVPVKMASLTVGLKRLPSPGLLAAFGMDSPLYLSVHSAWAKLGPEDTALIHAGKYLAPGKQTDAKSDQLELEQFLDLCQPGWKKELVATSYLPQMTVANAEVTARENGLNGRPDLQVQGLPGLYLCGDWVGDRGMLCDASFASAKQVAHRIVNQQNESQKVA